MIICIKLEMACLWGTAAYRQPQGSVTVHTSTVILDDWLTGRREKLLKRAIAGKQLQQTEIMGKENMACDAIYTKC